MTDAPERKGLYWTGRELGLPSGHTRPNVEYIRADLHQSALDRAVKAEAECERLRRHAEERLETLNRNAWQAQRIAQLEAEVKRLQAAL